MYKGECATTSFSSTSSKDSKEGLLFGEIESVVSTDTSQSSRTNFSTCNLTFSTSSAFSKFWLCDQARGVFLSQVSKGDLLNLRQVCHDFSHRIASSVFTDISVTFKSRTFTRPARIAALERIGNHIESFKLVINHDADTLLPPLIDPETGEEIAFVYEPQTFSPATLIDKVKNPKYGSWTLADLLVKQYPPLFHAATNVPSFVRAFSAVPNLKHLTISCPDERQPARRSVVDYCLISLRIAIERSCLDRLKVLSLLPIHEEGLFYLQPTLAFGASPRAVKRWSQIEDLTVNISSGSSGPASTTNAMKILHSYLRNFPHLRNLRFKWEGCKGPCPVSLHSEPQLQDLDKDNKGACCNRLRRLKFGRLEYLLLENATAEAAQITAFIARHRKTLHEFSFEDVHLRNGSWHEALAPLSNTKRHVREKESPVEVMDVPVFLSPETWNDLALANEKQEANCNKREASSLRRLWSTRVNKTSSKAKEQIIAGSGRMKKLLRYSVVGWR